MTKWIYLTVLIASYLPIPIMMICCSPPHDEGRMTLDDGTELHPVLLPWIVVHDDTVDHELVLEAIDWWNLGTSKILFLPSDNHDLRFGVIDISVGYCGDAGATFYDVTSTEGEILFGTIILSSDMAYDRDTMFLYLLHEMGHSLGLADDPYSLDLNSIMSSPVISGAGITTHDKGLLQ